MAQRLLALTTLLDWYGCASFRLRTPGLTVFLDAYIDRAPIAAGAGRSAADGVYLGDLGLSLQDQQARMAELTTFLSTELDPVAVEHLLGSMAGHSDRGDGGAFLFLFEMPDGTLLFQDTSGHWSSIVRELHPDVAIVAAAGRANVDGQPIQGALTEFVADQVEALAPGKVVLCHHDDWLPGFSVDTDIAPIREALAQRCPDVELLELDYVDGTQIF